MLTKHICLVATKLDNADTKHFILTEGDGQHSMEYLGKQSLFMICPATPRKKFLECARLRSSDTENNSSQISVKLITCLKVKALKNVSQAFSLEY